MRKLFHSRLPHPASTQLTDPHAAFQPHSTTTTLSTSIVITRFPTRPVAREVPVGWKVSSEDCLASTRVPNRWDRHRRAMAMPPPVIDIVPARLRVSRRMTRDPGAGIGRAARKSLTTKANCRAVLVVLEGLIASIAVIDRAIASLVRNAAAPETIITTNQRRSSIPASSGWKCRESKRKWRISVQCSRHRWRALQHQSLQTPQILIIVIRRIENTGNYAHYTSIKPTLAASTP